MAIYITIKIDHTADHYNLPYTWPLELALQLTIRIGHTFANLPHNWQFNLATHMIIITGPTILEFIRIDHIIYTVIGHTTDH